MKIRFENCTVNHVGTFYEGPGDAKIDVLGGSFTNVGQMVKINDPVSLLQYLGLPQNTPPEFLLEVFKIVRGTAGRPTQERNEQLRSSRLASLLGGAANIATIGATVAQILGVSSS